jgi:hypothetical protein
LSPFDAVGLVGVALMLGGYAGAQFHRLDPAEPPSLMLNFVGACLVLVSLTHAFNLAAAIVEAAWALVALFGLIRVFFRRR